VAVAAAAAVGEGNEGVFFIPLPKPKGGQEDKTTVMVAAPPLEETRPAASEAAFPELPDAKAAEPSAVAAGGLFELSLKLNEAVSKADYLLAARLKQLLEQGGAKVVGQPVGECVVTVEMPPPPPQAAEGDGAKTLKPSKRKGKKAATVNVTAKAATVAGGSSAFEIPLPKARA